MAMSKTEKRNAAKKTAIAQSQARKAKRLSNMDTQASGPSRKGKRSLVNTKKK